MTAKKILIIEDNKDTQLMLRTILEDAGYDISSALDANQGTMMLRQVKPHLVILDINMPAGSGYVVYQRIKNYSSESLTPVIIFTAEKVIEVEKKIPSDNNTIILQKHVGTDTLITWIRKLLRQDVQKPNSQ